MVKTLIAGACSVCYIIEIIPDTARESSETFYGQFQVIDMTEIIALYMAQKSLCQVTTFQ